LVHANRPQISIGPWEVGPSTVSAASIAVRNIKPPLLLRLNDIPRESPCRSQKRRSDHACALSARGRVAAVDEAAAETLH
jgi:hypothetical protein